MLGHILSAAKPLIEIVRFMSAAGKELKEEGLVGSRNVNGGLVTRQMMPELRRMLSFNVIPLTHWELFCSLETKRIRS